MKFVVVSILFFQCLLAGYYEDNLKFVNSYITYIQKQWNLTGGLDGGKFAPTLQKLNFTFNSCKPATIDDARKLMIEIMDYILYVYNSSNIESLNLSNYPYDPSNIEIYINFISNNEVGQIQYASNIGNRIFYRLNTQYGEYRSIRENFEEAYLDLYGKKWDPFRYGDCSDAEIEVGQ